MLSIVSFRSKKSSKDPHLTVEASWYNSLLMVKYELMSMLRL